MLTLLVVTLLLHSSTLNPRWTYVAAGCCEVTEFLLSKGVPVDIDSGWGTPLGRAAYNGKYDTLKILLDHHANVGRSSFLFYLSFLAVFD